MIWIITDNTTEANELVTVAFSESALEVIKYELEGFDHMTGEHRHYTIKAVQEGENGLACLQKESTLDT